MSHEAHSSILVFVAGCLLAGCGLVMGCSGGQQTGNYGLRTGGNAAQGKALMKSYGCGSCHVIPGIYTARGMVGPPLLYFSRRTMIAGELPNSPENLVRWIRNPLAIEPGTAMPDLGVSNDQAYDMAAYLYTLR